MLEDGFQTILAIMYTINSGKTFVFVVGINVIYCLLRSALRDTCSKTKEWLVKQASLSIMSANPIRADAFIVELGKIVIDGLFDLSNSGLSDMEVVNTIAAVLSRENHVRQLDLGGQPRCMGTRELLPARKRSIRRL
eukprot:335344-Amphidinium_carterae.2